MIKGAVIELNRRYQLWRIWEQEKPLLLYILLNPSRANAEADDKTVTKLIRFSKSWGYGGFYLGNIHSFITPYPSVLKNKIIKKDSINEMHLKSMRDRCEKVVFGWGNAAEFPQWLNYMYFKAFCFGINKNGSPKHPLYLSYQTELIPFMPFKILIQ